MTTTQEPQKGTMEEVELDFPHQDDNYWMLIQAGGRLTPQYPSPLEVKMLIHHQLQKARQDWLREEIVRLEEEKLEAELHYDMRGMTETKAYCSALQTIIDRYNEELNQDPAHDFFTAPEEVQRPVYERALQKTQEEQEKPTNTLTMTHTNHTDSVEKLKKIEDSILSRTEPHFVDGTKILLDDYKATLQATLSQQVEEAVRKITSLPVYYRSKYSRDCSRSETEEEKSTEMVELEMVLQALTPNHQD